MAHHITGLVAAAFSPMHADGSINTAIIRPITDRLIDNGVAGLYVCGSTGEGPSLSATERRRVAEAYIEASDRRIPIIVHVGHDSLAEACALAEHAATSGADAIAAVSPCYFKPQSVGGLVAFLAQIARAAPHLDFYYYHVPQLNGNNIDLMELFEKAPSNIPSFKGVKYTALEVHKFQECKALYGDRFQIFFGCDEMLTSGLAGGADAMIGSTYNLVPRLYRKVMDSFLRGDVRTACELQLLSVQMVRVCSRYRCLPAIKAMMKMIGLDCGPNRLPLESLTEQELKTFASEIEALGICDWF